MLFLRFLIDVYISVWQKYKKAFKLRLYVLSIRTGKVRIMDIFEYFCALKRNYMNIRVSIRFILLAVVTLCAFAETLAGIPQVQVKLVLISVSGDSTVLAPGESSPQTLNAPLQARFMSELVTDDGKDYVLFPEWTVIRTYTDDETSRTENYLKRQESNTGFEFTDYGKFQVNYAWSYREKESSETIPGEYVDSILFTIDDSDLRLYNAFSPNGDGINDVYKIYVRSVVSMKIAIFNRWGQTIKTVSGKMDDILPADAEPDNDGGFLFEVWDGTFNGDVVNDGVYFINVQAVGAGGRQYDKRADINVLKGLGTGN